MELKYNTDSEPGYSRKGRGKGFEYFEEGGKKITDPTTLTRINALVIPPMWKNVWIAKDPNAHLQATGYDAKGRKQYLYHEEWSRMRNEDKFQKMVEFGHVLPQIRQRVQADLRKKDWPREKVVALIVSILDQSCLRVGNRTYEIENGTYGLTNMRRKHLDMNGSSVSFEFIAKGGKPTKVNVKGRRLTRLIRECSQLPGHEVFQYLDENGDRHQVHSHDVNEYLQDITGDAFTAKDFRTWGGTVTAVERYEEALAELEEYPQRKLANCIIKKVAQRLNNTLAVCRKYYIHPGVLQTFSVPAVDLRGLTKKATARYAGLTESLSDSELVALYAMEKY